jgi:hypothetical protein
VQKIKQYPGKRSQTVLRRTSTDKIWHDI